MLKFVFKFAVITLCFHALSLVPGWEAMLSELLHKDAQLSCLLLSLVREPCQVSGANIWSAKNAITVAPDCSALEYAGFYGAAVLAFPAPILRKVVGVLLGTGILLAANLARVASLYWMGVHFPALFDTAHTAVWPGVLVIVTLLACIAWLQWITRGNEPRTA